VVCSGTLSHFREKGIDVRSLRLGESIEQLVEGSKVLVGAIFLQVCDSALIRVEVSGKVDGHGYVQLGPLVSSSGCPVDDLRDHSLELLNDLPPHGVQILYGILGL
jgi:hypothetical protein